MELYGNGRKAAGGYRVERIGFKPDLMAIVQAYTDFAYVTLSAAFP